MYFFEVNRVNEFLNLKFIISLYASAKKVKLGSDCKVLK